MTRIRIGTRGSQLALWQANETSRRLRDAGYDPELVIVKTTGDKRHDVSLATIGGKGLFIKELEEALERREIDVAVHSLKDVPSIVPDHFVLAGFLERADPRDAWLSRDGSPLEAIGAGARVGTTSLRRQAQLRALRPDLEIVDLRGNVDTRLRKLRAGEFDAILLAMAGLTRLGRAGEVTQALEPETLLPAPGQGAIALECRADDAAVAAAVEPLHHANTADAVRAERAFLARLGGGCNVPLGAFAQAEPGAGQRLRAFVAREDGGAILRGERRGEDPQALGHGLAEDLLERGAEALLRPGSD
jgi:hydroxymethylbilane synthase